MNIKLIRTLTISGSVATVGFGLWHSVFPFLTHSSSYLPGTTREVANTVLATSAFLAFSLVLLGGLALAIALWHWDKIEVVRLSSWALTILWLMRVMYEFALPMSSGGTLTIASRSVRNSIQFEFIDNGCGMSPEIQAHLFEPFVSGKGVHESGLGLALVRKILDEHHARVEVESVLAKGTTIRVVFPRR